MTERRALVAAPSLPQPDRDSGSRRLVDLVGFLRDDGWHVTFATVDAVGEPRYRTALEAAGVPVVHADPGELVTLLDALRPTLALLAYWPTAELLLPVIRQVSPATRVLVDSVDLHLLRQARSAAAIDGPDGLLDAAWGELAAAELNVYRAADGVLTVSAREAALIDDLLGTTDRAMAVPDVEPPVPVARGFGDRSGILFVGSFRHAPNVDAVGFLCREIVPRIAPELLVRHPVLIVGNEPGPEIAGLVRGRPSVRLVGWVPAMGPWLSSARVNVLPLRSGAGTKRKLLAALMAGLPSVSTPVGIEGFPVVDGHDVLVASDPDAFAAAVARLLTDRDAWESLARAGRDAAMAAHAPEVARAALGAAVASVLGRPAAPALLPPIELRRHHERRSAQYQAFRASVAHATGARDDRTRAPGDVA